MNNFKLWIDDGKQTITTLMSADDFKNDSQRQNGFIAGTTSSSIRVNSGLRQANLVAKAFMDVVAPDNTNLSLQSKVIDVVDAINTYFKNMFTNKIVANTTQITSLKKIVDDNKTSIDAEFTSLKSTINSHNNRIIQNANNISQNAANITTNKNDISKLNKSITTLDGKITTLDNTVSKQGDDITSLSSNVTTIESNVANLSNDITNLSNDISDITTDITNIKAKHLYMHNVQIDVSITTILEHNIDMLKLNCNLVTSTNTEFTTTSIKTYLETNKLLVNGWGGLDSDNTAFPVYNVFISGNSLAGEYIRSDNTAGEILANKFKIMNVTDNVIQIF